MILALIMTTASWIALIIGALVIVALILGAAYLWRINGVDPLRSDKEYVDEEEAGMY